MKIVRRLMKNYMLAATVCTAATLLLATLLDGTAEAYRAVSVSRNVRRGTVAALATDARYPYGGDAFRSFVADSYENKGSGNPNSFFRWMDQALDQNRRFVGLKSGGWYEFTAQKRQELDAITDPEVRAKQEMALCTTLYVTLKRMMPNFNLTRGFEFTYATANGERQCLLQSVVAASLLQAMDVNAGIAIVNRSTGGETSNNGHVVALVRLSNGKDGLLDLSSHGTTFERMQGILVASEGGYRYVEPIFDDARNLVVGYRPASGSPSRLATDAVQPVNVAFVRSQFDFYRGERAPGGFLAKQADQTASGLATSARYLERAVKECPDNPLAVFVLGRVYARQGKPGQARTQYAEAFHLYSQFGWVPDDPRADYQRTATATSRFALPSSS